MIYKVWIQIEEIDENVGHYQNLGLPYEAGKFKTEKDARRFVENELMIVRAINTKLRQACQAGLKFLDSLPETELTTELQNRQAFHKLLNDAINQNIPAVNDSCPKCGAGSDERELISKDFLGIEAIHMHYTCKNCSSEIIEEFTLTDVFIDNEQ